MSKVSDSLYTPPPSTILFPRPSPFIIHPKKLPYFTRTVKKAPINRLTYLLDASLFGPFIKTWAGVVISCILSPFNFIFFLVLLPFCYFLTAIINIPSKLYLMWSLRHLRYTKVEKMLGSERMWLAASDNESGQTIKRKRITACCVVVVTMEQTSFLSEQKHNLGDLKTIIDSKVVRAFDSKDDSLTFPRLSEILVNLTCGKAWVSDNHYNIENHVFEIFSSPNTATEFLEFVSVFSTLPFAADKPRWRAYVLFNYPAQRNTIIFSYDPAIGDGVYMLRVLCNGLADAGPLDEKMNYGASNKNFENVRSLFNGIVWFFKYVISCRPKNIDDKSNFCLDSTLESFPCSTKVNVEASSQTESTVSKQSRSQNKLKRKLSAKNNVNKSENTTGEENSKSDKEGVDLNESTKKKQVEKSTKENIEADSHNSDDRLFRDESSFIKEKDSNISLNKNKPSNPIKMNKSFSSFMEEFPKDFLTNEDAIKRKFLVSAPIQISDLEPLRDVTMTTLDELVLALLTSSLRDYYQNIMAIEHPFDTRASVTVGLQNSSLSAPEMCFDTEVNNLDLTAKDSHTSKDISFQNIQMTEELVPHFSNASTSQVELKVLNSHQSKNSPTSNVTNNSKNSYIRNSHESTYFSDNLNQLHSSSPIRKTSYNDHNSQNNNNLESPKKSKNKLQKGYVKNIKFSVKKFSSNIIYYKNKDVVPGYRPLLSNHRISLPTNTEGIIPQLWHVKNRLIESKVEPNALSLYNASRMLYHIMSDTFYNFLNTKLWGKHEVEYSSLVCPPIPLTIGGKSISNVFFWGPIKRRHSIGVSMMSYCDTITLTLSIEEKFKNPELILHLFSKKLDDLKDLLRLRRVKHQPRVDCVFVPLSSSTKRRRIIEEDAAEESKLREPKFHKSISTLAMRKHSISALSSLTGFKSKRK